MTTGPKYRQLADELIRRIRDGEFATGPLPSRSALQKAGWGERTVHEAMRALVNEGWVTSVPGAGVYPAERLPEPPVSLEDRVAELERKVAALERDRAE